MIKLLHIIGTRPHIIKYWAIHRALQLPEFKDKFESKVIWTGQHFSPEMSDKIFAEFGIKISGSLMNKGHTPSVIQLGELIISIFDSINYSQPDYVFVYGDCTTTLAGALAVMQFRNINHDKPHLVHIEAGLRSNNWYMPEEKNRVITDRVSDLLFAASFKSNQNLESENLLKHQKVFFSGDVMYDNVQYALSIKGNEQTVYPLDILGELASKDYAFLTIHRDYNTDHLDSLLLIVDAVESLLEKNPELHVLWPIHPRLKKIIKGDFEIERLHIIEPLSYYETLYAVLNSQLVMTDSGGLQKEAVFMDKPCMILRTETEWGELITLGQNRVKLVKPEDISNLPEYYEEMINSDKKYDRHLIELYFGKGNAAELILSEILKQTEK